MAIGGRTEPVRALMLRLTQLFDLTGHPAISIPCGTTAAGLPCGLQLVGRIGRTDDLLAVALACEEVMRPA
jgi:Asp-tRNA(Asn)/Glu-tRNA(Gln) amidotransferase A subunit family amidase